MRSAKRLMAGAVALTLAAVLVLPACGAGATPLSIVSKSPAKTTDAKTAKLSEQIVVTPKAAVAGGKQHFNVDGDIDFAATKGTLTTRVVGQSIDTVLDGTVIYERIPGLASQTGGKEWIKFDFATLGKLSGIEGMENLLQSQGSDPAAGLQQLRGVTGSVTKAGHEKIRGTNTTKYTATVDMAKAAAAAPPKQQAPLKQIVEQFGITTVPMEVWIDSSGRVRRSHQVVDYTNAKGTAKVPAESLPQSVEMTVEFFDFGTPVSIKVPAANEVEDLADLLTKEQGSNATTATSVAPSNATSALEKRLITTVPAGFKQEADNVGDTGPSNLEKAAADDGDADAKAVLVRDGFVAGYQRLWTNADRELINFLYQFKTAAGAGDYMKRTLSSLSSEDNAKSFAVPGIPGATGMSFSGADGSGAGVVFTRGSYLAQVMLNGDVSTDAVISLAQQQFQKLG